MRYLNKISASAHQRFNLTGNKGQSITMTLKYRPSQEAWYADFEYEGRSINSVRIVNSPNILRKFRNIFPFGLQCVTRDGLDPVFVDDFSNQNASLYLLDEDEVSTVEESIY